MTVPQIFFAASGAVLCVGCFVAVLFSRTYWFKAIFGTALGVALMLAGFKPQVIEFFGADTQDLRLRLVISVISFMVLAVTLEAIRLGRMRERYAVLWLTSAGLLILLSLCGGLALFVTRISGMSYADTVLVALFAILLLVVFSLSVALSAMQKKQAQAVISQALLEKRLRKLEEGRAVAAPEKNETDPRKSPK